MAVKGSSVCVGLALLFLVWVSLQKLSSSSSSGGLLPQRRQLGGLSHLERVSDEPARQPSDQLWIETVSWEPRALVLHNFLSHEECDHLIQQALPTMEKSNVVDNDSGKSVSSKVRTSSGTFLQRGADPIITRIEDRIAYHAQVPVQNGEGLQVLHYQIGELYQAHFDYFHDAVNVMNGGQRVATMLMYLSDVESGGETVFPDSDEKPHAKDSQIQDCARDGVAVMPRKGDALLFYSLQLDGSLDPKSLHAGCPVISGNKWSATKWMRVNEFRT